MSSLYTYASQLMLSGGINMTTDTIRVSIGRVAGYTFSAAHQFKAAVATAYDADAALTNVSITGGVLDADDSLFSSVLSGSAINFILLWKDTGNTATSPVIAYIDGFTPVTPNGSSLLITWDATTNRIFKL